jgi:ferredoxin-NADP reductase
MLLEAIHNNSPQQMILFYSNYRPEDCAFAQEFFELDKNHKYFRCIPTMTEMEKSKQPWDGETGFIDLAMLKRYLPDINQPRYYIVGSPGFVKAMTAMLETAAIAKEKIKLEKFTGL